MEKHQKKDGFIEMLRGFSVILVVYYHYSNRIPHQALGATEAATLVSHEGKLGVYIFFIISGFLIALSMETCRSLSDFYAKRISRIWPLFILASTIIFVFLTVFTPPSVPLGPKQFYENGRPPLKDFVGQLFFLRDIGFDWVDGVFWSILVELKFYLWIGLFAALFRERYIAVFAKVAIGLSLLDFGLILFVGPQARSLSAILHGVFIAQYMSFFAVGLLLYHGRRDQLLIALIVLCAVQICITFSDDPDFQILDTARWFTVLSALMAIDHFLLGGRLMIFCGTYSYSLYLFHHMIGITIMSWVAPDLGMDMAILVALACVLPLSVAGSWAVEWRYRRRIGGLLASAFALLRLDRIDLPAAAREPAKGDPKDAAYIASHDVAR